MNILTVLQEKGVIDGDLLTAVTQEAERGASMEEALLSRGVEPEKLLAALGDYYRLPTRELGEYDKIEPSVLRYLSEDSARHYQMLPLSLRDGVMEIGVTNPDDLSALDALNFIASKESVPYKLVLILERDLKKGLALYDNLTGEVESALSELEMELSAELKKKGGTAEVEKDEQGEEHIKEDAPVTKIVATILRYAVDGRASDIHIEPTGEKVHVRFRVDGVLVTSLELPQQVQSAVVARVKILTSMRLDERRKPQDGRFSATIDDRKIDFRVSTLPTHYGEKVVMRILDPQSGVHTLEETGIAAHHLEIIRKAIEAPYGIILISGPTGSGKTTTLYGMLAEVDRVGKNVVSLEDPVEYNIAGVSQSQVRPEIGYTFASGLRSVLRQDPDVIMVGEIRDKETAQLAIQAALTGHLVLATIHTNNAIGVIPRLMDMGIDPYLIAPTLILALAQRLVLKICPDSGRKVQFAGSVKMSIDHEFETLPQEFRSRIPAADHVLALAPSPSCPTGTRGRTAVVEVLPITEEIQELILKRASEDELYEVARKKGFMTMKEDAILKALKHTIPFEEVNTLGGALLSADAELGAAPAEEPSVPAGTPQVPAESV